MVNLKLLYISSQLELIKKQRIKMDLLHSLLHQDIVILKLLNYRISVGADKEAKVKNGRTALDYSGGAVRKYLESIAKK
ncbi:hypothetical protein TVAG_453970 [Trichomonas vaginalis G3]|uniref:Ankyrin repeat protein n=1 Tax=Trichomonas vaginalis (strain ATCC PRA-98 / G3) TaxID=412133 RepID=A2DPX3_TRIV3|nr:hypothetical protein TVAGG3_0552450 [Trichomonas vaginalis G3]EAY17569.1 hypothetical protein TVAG_453970 [Trichomonas vaginalis G3]KAI5520613.1 hypothetical protein TVAGG3_0552450 [Trichomonas vaginalis G3]|eukprot:XP_001329704.1 hypothetical protein [Trichomonas vaginalis G3]